MKKLNLLASGVVAALLPAQAFAQPDEDQGDWDATIGLAAMQSPITPGVEQTEIDILPYIDVMYKDRYFLNFQNGLGAYLVKREDQKTGIFEDFAIGVAIDFDEGRNPDDLDDTPILMGLNEIDSTIEGTAFVEAEVGFVEIKASFAQDLAEGHEGWRSELSASVDIPLSQRAFVSVQTGVQYSSEDYQQSYFGIDAVEAVATGYAEYTPEAGFDSASVGLIGQYGLTRKVGLLGFVEYEQLLGDAKDSPFVEEEGQVTVAVGIGYRF